MKRELTGQLAPPTCRPLADMNGGALTTSHPLPPAPLLASSAIPNPIPATTVVTSAAAAAAAAALSVPASGMVCPMPPALTMPLAPSYLDNSSIPPPPPEGGAFMCIQCGKAFKEHAELVAHDMTCNKVIQNPGLALSCDRYISPCYFYQLLVTCLSLLEWMILDLALYLTL